MPRGRLKIGETKMTSMMTLRLTEAEMLRLRLSALGMKRSRSGIVRERIADLIGMAPVSNDGRVPEEADNGAVSQEPRETVTERIDAKTVTG